ncbi:hypothetical protein M2137_002639 [Parabacteroides sp. PFB2-10]|uniref:PDZ domain-containing protein n=1 Tax=Parabacteroides sp. PFB2-10 TaxID=1742405 RepID=UPI002476ED14|nr:PDZ domain-containing protein [Parabacteroides sp. PFB2-10]MDH6313848.1 hypothetical protein [Parabacteroides sp. PFB2-10]
MKRIIFSIALLAISLIGFAQNRPQICRIGFSYEISHSPNWGLGFPVVTRIVPYSSAEQMGIKQGDILEAIDNVPTLNLSEMELNQLLNPADRNEITLTIRSFSNPQKKVAVRKDCKLSNAITEEQLAIAFNMYSLETTSERRFVCPFNMNVTPDPVDFAAFSTFTFSAIDESNRNMETAINGYIEKELTQKGLIYDPEQPEIRVETFYFFDKNPNYKGPSKVMVNKEVISRYDVNYSRMIDLPFLNHQTAESEAEFLLQFGFRFVDLRIEPGRVIWECEAHELLENSFRLEDYARIHIPLMLMQYPYVKYTRNVPFTVSRKTYNYTGIQYDIDQLERVAAVDANSPAYAAGVRVGDTVDRIGNQRMNHTAEELTGAYKRFITNTMNLRDPKTQFKDANGFEFCMYWDSFKYTQVANALQRSNAMAPFAYLYYFAPYINLSGNNACSFVLRRGKEKQEVLIRPTVRTDVTIEVK